MDMAANLSDVYGNFPLNYVSLRGICWGGIYHWRHGNLNMGLPQVVADPENGSVAIIFWLGRNSFFWVHLGWPWFVHKWGTPPTIPEILWHSSGKLETIGSMSTQYVDTTIYDNETLRSTAWTCQIGPRSSTFQVHWQMIVDNGCYIIITQQLKPRS